MTPGQHVTLTIESRLEDVPLLGSLVNAVCAQLGFSGEERSLSEVCVVEAVNNCIEHAYQDAPGHAVEVEIRLEEDRVLFNICDSGKSADPRFMHADHRGALDMSLERPEGLNDGGRGLAIMQEFMDAVEYTPGLNRNQLRLTKRLAGRRPAAASG